MASAAKSRTGAWLRQCRAGSGANRFQVGGRVRRLDRPRHRCSSHPWIPAWLLLSLIPIFGRCRSLIHIPMSTLHNLPQTLTAPQLAREGTVDGQGQPRPRGRARGRRRCRRQEAPTVPSRTSEPLEGQDQVVGSPGAPGCHSSVSASRRALSQRPLSRPEKGNQRPPKGQAGLPARADLVPCAKKRAGPSSVSQDTWVSSSGAASS